MALNTEESCSELYSLTMVKDKFCHFSTELEITHRTAAPTPGLVGCVIFPHTLQHLPLLQPHFKINDAIQKGNRAKVASHTANSLNQLLGKGNLQWREVKALCHLWMRNVQRSCRAVLPSRLWAVHVPGLSSTSSKVTTTVCNR